MIPIATAILLLAAPVEADVVIRDVEIHAGDGQPATRGDLAWKNDRIVGVGQFELTGNPRVIDGRGYVAAPGFIDLHTHSDSSILARETRRNTNYLLQGVTTIVTGNCGAGPTNVSQFLADVEKNQAGTNVLHLIPHGSVRQQVMGGAQRAPRADELAKMKELFEAGMEGGAWGMSTGLIYTPGSFAQTQELIELAAIVARHHGIYASHIRGEGERLLDSLEEALEIGRRAQLPVHISHFKASGKTAWGMAAEAIRLVEQARAQGQKVTADQYPYVASSTSLAATLIPSRVRSLELLNAALDDPGKGPELRKQIRADLVERDGGRAIFIASYSPNRTWQGKNLAEIAAQEQMEPLDLVLQIERNGGAKIVHFSMNEEDVRLFMRQPFVATASDGSSTDPNSPTVPHPRSYGCFPRKIGRYAIEERLLPLEQAIRSATGLPADILGLPERGYLRPGHYADLVVFDPKTFRDQATFERPHQFATGVQYLLVNGVLAVDEGRPTDALAGRALRKPQPSEN